MLTRPDRLPARLWVVPHVARARGEPTVRPLLSDALHCKPCSLPISRDAGGRPRLGAPYRHMDIGWSHSGEVLVLALGESMELGVDVERVRNRPRMPEIAARFFHPDEASRLQALPPQSMADAFVRLWCAKEAVLKAHGKGLSFGLHKLVFAPIEGALSLIHCDPALGAPGDWRLHEWAPIEGYRAALAWRPL